MAMPPAALMLAGLAALTLWSPHLSAAAAAAAAPPTVIHLVADDLGYHDTNWKNHQVSTDALDALVGPDAPLWECAALVSEAGAPAQTVHGDTF